MSEEKRFYVYVHRYASGPREGQVFYVGKGTACRYSRPSCRNLHWNRIVSKYGFVPEKVMYFRGEECALSFEVALIRHYGRKNLCNMTDGGEGAANISDDTRKRKSELISGRNHNLLDEEEYCFIHEDGTVFIGIRYDFGRLYGLNNVSVFKLARGVNKKVKGWMMLNFDTYSGGFLPKVPKVKPGNRKYFDWTK